MSRISQDLADQIAAKLTKKSFDAVKELRKEYEDLVLVTYQSQVPDEVAGCFKKHHDWFTTTTSVQLDGHGFRYEYVDVHESVLCNAHRGAIIKMTSALADIFTKSKRKWQKAKEEAENLNRETRTALINLRTYKNIREAIPEAAPFIPPPITNAIAVNVSALNKKLATQPDAKKEKEVTTK